MRAAAHSWPRHVAWLTLALAVLALPPISLSAPATAEERLDRSQELLRTARLQREAGQLEQAHSSVAQVLAREPDHPHARRLMAALEAELLKARAEAPRRDTRDTLLDAVARSWTLPQASVQDSPAAQAAEESPLKARLEAIVIPRVSFEDAPLGTVLDTLALMSEDDPAAEGGLNLVLLNPRAEEPRVTMTLRQLDLARVLDFITESVDYFYELERDAVVVRPLRGMPGGLRTEVFALPRSTQIRLIGVSAIPETLPGGRFGAPRSPSGDEDPVRLAEALRQFWERAGVSFERVEGAGLAVADGQLIVTQTPRNLRRIGDILRQYSSIKQVEIEARFLEVSLGDLEELGVNWQVTLDANRAGEDQLQSSNRSLESAFTVGGSGRAINVTGTADALNLPQPVPVLPEGLDLATGAGDLARITGVIGSADVEVLLRALERETGNDLLSAPKITVLSGKTAEIVVAQEFRYPQRFADTEASVGRGDSDAGSAGVAITAGTPRDFTVRNIGVEMEVTPTVEQDGSISLVLAPQVTEFDGFVEYGGASVAIASNTTVTVPSGFLQPIFSVRRIKTEVTIFNGATVVMGGLTREQVVHVEDKVPVLGDLPVLGGLFRSEGRSSEKRNLLIFVTARLVGQGGAAPGS